jgi:cold shock CspA family protein
MSTSGAALRNKIFSMNGKDVFMHIFAVERAGLGTLREGQQIEYEIVEDRGKISAVKLRSSDPPTVMQ